MSRKPGPKTDVPAGTPLERVTLTLDALTRRKFRVLGNGNESMGARVAARVAYDRYQAEDKAFSRGTTTVEPAAPPEPSRAPP